MEAINLEPLQEADIQWMMSAGKVIEIEADRLLLTEAKTVDTFNVLLAGKISYSVSGQGVKNMTCAIGELSPGGLFGEMFFIDDRPASVTLKTLEPSRILSISQQQLIKKIAVDGGFAVRFYHHLALTVSRKFRLLSDLLVRNKIIPGEALRKVWLAFAVLTDSDISWMVNNGKYQESQKGKVLITQGKAVENLYILLEGVLSIFISISAEGKTIEKEVAKSLKGEILGEMSFVEMGNASATVKVAEKSLLLAIPQRKLTAKIKEDAEFGARFYRAIAVIIVDRWRDRLIRLGFGSYQDEELIDEFLDEIDMEDLDKMAIAGIRFQWMLERLHN